MVIVTNQSGIAKGSYDKQFVLNCFQRIQDECSQQIDAMYLAPGHESVSKTLMRKPDSLMFEKAIAKYKIDPEISWMIGDKERDLIPAKKLGIKTVLVGNGSSDFADNQVKNLVLATTTIMNASES